MFTGIIESLGKLEKAGKHKTNLDLTFSAPIAQELKVDQSLAHNGVCLTVTSVNGDRYTVTAIKETLDRTNLGELVPGAHVNLERCMRADGRFDGHIVQGHVDCTGVCASMRDLEGSWEFVFNHHKDPQFVTVPKGSITVNGVSLTVVDSSEESFSVHVIPYTFEHTNFREILPGTKVNLEFDIVGKYVARLIGSR